MKDAIVEDTLFGQFVSEYRLDYLRFALQILLFGAICLFWIIEFSSDAFGLFLASLFGLGALRAFYYLVAGFGWRVQLFSNGFTFSKGQSTHSISWGDIETIWKKQYKHTVNFIPFINLHQLKIEVRGKQSHKLDRRIKKFPELSQLILQHFISLQFPVALGKLENGETLEFGPFKLSNSILTYNDHSVKWEELGEIQLWQGNVYIKKAGTKGVHRWFTTNNWVVLNFWKPWNIPNFDLMMFLIQNYLSKDS